ncbi:precorrin-6y C5,15-methyltransferase (decarboxylating) subunit CbiE [Solwaraspora sp. WMMD1047]|uniref:precorrin-6y C5,15-methyltransferase (decarboxylating) subunit CbiE n=1 Tax=Solwaraspora sp. WMMD1047 TaxID=3016102 RepID=UPI002415EB14|nr:precorrin-6y C5,15-methyltransferase (decarboxylating) subunit CbiE [Solwaraspora sp. WMMD1047]MDG4832849.1 precorrin-6y C5,15-methyltransferase (decarboxylating) subunit CbiE [Solwaraspora sp. WMMD1047]
MNFLTTGPPSTTGTPPTTEVPSTAGAPATVAVVGIGADGWSGLTPAARAAIGAAGVLFGGRRQLAMVPAELPVDRIAWPSPMLPALPDLLATHADRRICVLASGDPMWFGVGARIADLLGPDRLTVYPHPSSISLACARLGWAVERTTVVSAVGRRLDRVRRALHPGRNLLVLSADAGTPAALAAVFTEAGFGASELTVLESVGGPDEGRVTGVAAGWAHPPGAALNLVGVRVAAAPETRVLSTVPGLPDDAFQHDGALTKREARALALSRLAPLPGELLWDVGAGSGSVAVEWMRTDPSCRAVAVESRPDRADRIEANAGALGVPDLVVVRGAAPAVLADLPRPDAVFVGGGVTVSGLVDAAWAALPAGGRLVAHAVTIEGERVLTEQAARRGGDLTRLGVERAGPLGGFTGWRPARPLVQWAAVKRAAPA